MLKADALKQHDNEAFGATPISKNTLTLRIMTGEFT
jgi:hypothetical protein